MRRTEIARAPWRPLSRIALYSCISLLALAAGATGTAGAATAEAAAAAAPRAVAVAAPDEFGARTAMEVMKRGGNAVDAAVATAFVLAVTYPEAGNLGGGGFMMIYEHGKGSFLDYRETAPAAATRNMYLDDKGEVIKDASLIGPRAAGVPGTVAGLWAAHQRYGRRPWRELLQPAITLARDGYTASAPLAHRIQEARGSYAGLTNFDRYYGQVREGERFRQPELAATLEGIAARGRRRLLSRTALRSGWWRRCGPQA